MIDVCKREVLSKNYENFNVKIFQFNDEDIYAACLGLDKNFIGRNKYSIKMNEVEKEALSGSGFQDSLEKAYSNIRRQILKKKENEENKLS